MVELNLPRKQLTCLRLTFDLMKSRESGNSSITLNGRLCHFDQFLNFKMKPKSDDPFLSHNSASLAEAQRHIKALDEENLTLKRDLANISSLYNVLVKDGEKEKFDERRINLLKSQLIQLERQVVMLTDSLGSRAGVLLEVENGLHRIAEISRNHLSEERGAVTVPRDSLKNIVATAESCRIKLAKNVENSSPKTYARPLLMMDKFVKQTPRRRVSLYDVCSGSIEHINLKHVGKLESKLAQVFHQLSSIYHSLETNTGDVSHAGTARLVCQVTKAQGAVQQATADLMELSILVPSAPWPAIQKPLFKDITTEDVLSSLPNFPKSRAHEGQEKIEALVKTFNYLLNMKKLELKSTNTEGLESMKTAYTDFENNTNDILCKPLKGILVKYDALEQRASESDLRNFLAAFKLHAPDISNAISQLDHNRDDRVGACALSTFGEQFFESIDKLQADCILAREKAINELDVVKKDVEENQIELKKLFPSTNLENNRIEYKQVVAGMEDMSLPSSLNQEIRDISSSDVDLMATPSARDRRRAAKKATASEHHSMLPTLPANNSLVSPSTETFDEHTVDSAEDTTCTCGAEADDTWISSLRRYTPAEVLVQTDEEVMSTPTIKPPLGLSRHTTGLQSPTDPARKLLPSRLPKAQAKMVSTPTAGGVSKRPRTPQFSGKPNTPKSGTAQGKLTLNRRDNRSHSLDNSEQGLSLLSETQEQSPSMKRSSSLSQRPDWVT